MPASPGCAAAAGQQTLGLPSRAITPHSSPCTRAQGSCCCRHSQGSCPCCTATGHYRQAGSSPKTTLTSVPGAPQSPWPPLAAPDTEQQKPDEKNFLCSDECQMGQHIQSRTSVLRGPRLKDQVCGCNAKCILQFYCISF